MRPRQFWVQIVGFVYSVKLTHLAQTTSGESASVFFVQLFGELFKYTFAVYVTFTFLWQQAIELFSDLPVGLGQDDVARGL